MSGSFTPKPFHAFVADDDDDVVFGGGLSTATRRSQRLSGATPATTRRTPVNVQRSREEMSAPDPIPMMAMQTPASSQARPPQIPVTNIPDESPAPKLPRKQARREDTSAVVARPLAETGAAERESTGSRSSAGRSRPSSNKKKAKGGAAPMPAYAQPTATMMSVDDAPTQETMETPSQPEQRAANWYADPCTATQEALNPADGFQPPSPPPAFTMPSVSMARTQQAEEKLEDWAKNFNAFFDMIDKRDLKIDAATQQSQNASQKSAKALGRTA